MVFFYDFHFLFSNFVLSVIDMANKTGDILSMNVQTDAIGIGQMIARTSGILGGKPCVSGHRIAVHRIAGWWKAGLTVEEIGERFSTLTPAEIHIALAYYHLHREEIESYLEEEHVMCRQLERKLPTPV